MSRLNIIPYPNYADIRGEGIALTAIDRSAMKPDITPEIKNPEGYELDTSGGKIRIRAGGPRGAFYATRTLRQLVDGGEGYLPSVFIKDEPAFPYRGFMLDSARHMTSVDDIKKLIDAAALLKMNVFHWHLTDDQGWRFEVPKYPALTQIGAWRSGSDFGKVHSSERYGGYYTHAEIRDVVAYCAKQHMEVIPEVDMPGHMIAAIASYPELSCTGNTIPVETRQGIFPDILCAGKDSTFDFVFAVIDEICALFSSKYIHIGGDEAPKKRWKVCPDCQRRMQEFGLNDEEELQGWFVNSVAEYLQKHGRIAIGWNEVLKSGLIENNLIVQMWMDRKKLSAAFANEGGRIIVSPFYHYYTDYPYGMTPLDKTYEFNPILKGITPLCADNVVGVEAPIWTEHVRDFQHLCYMTYPRFAAVAETGWTKAANKDTFDFCERMERFLPQLMKCGIVPAPPDDWNPGMFERLKQTLAFFRSTLTLDMIRGYK